MKADHAITVHRFEATLFPVNAYLIETPTSVVAVDATLGVTDGKTLRSRVEALNKPLAAVIVTHAHPDHYGGVAGLLGDADIPVYAVAGVNEVIRRDDAAKEQILRPMFGEEWPATRRFPTRIVQGGERVSIADAMFSVTDLGPSESPHDSLWRLEADGAPQVFVGDLVYSHMHGFLADGFYDRWLVNLERSTRDLPADAMPRHGTWSARRRAGHPRVADQLHPPLPRRASDGGRARWPPGRCAEGYGHCGNEKCLANR